MFCYQCEQTAKGQGCTIRGVCGKSPDTAALQDLLVHVLRGIALHAVEARKSGVSTAQADGFACEGLFSTLTNVDFDPLRFVALIEEGVRIREELKRAIDAADGWTDFADPSASFTPAKTVADLVSQGEKVGVMSDPALDPDIRSLRELLTYGIKGVAAYAYHARDLGQQDEKVYAFLHEALAATLDAKLGVDDLVKLALRCGEINLRAMELLDAGNTGRYGHPVPTQVPLGVRKGKALLVSGHDLGDLEKILEQTAGKGITVYTHGEMLPCHGYPELKKYEHFFGHYGTGWQNQAREFARFPGAIVMTTNCIQKPRDEYQENIFTTGPVGFPGVKHIADKDFSPAVERALALPGFESDVEAGSVMVGFARNAVLGVADKVIEAVKNKQIRHFFLVGGCDGAKPGRSYYGELVDKIPPDCVVLTLACGKFRFFDKHLGDIGGIPRLLDVGQCNDAYSAIQIASALAGAFNCGVNDLPLSLILSWYEQKACAILLTLLHLGIRDIRLGPSLPAFVTPNLLKVLVDNFNIMPITTVDDDLRAILGDGAPKNAATESARPAVV